VVNDGTHTQQPTTAPATTQEDNARARLLYDKVARFNGFIRYDYPL